MNHLLKNYLKRVCLLLKKKNRVGTYRELRGHFLDQIDADTSKGINENSSIHRILDSLPHPLWMGYKLRRSQQSFLRRHIFEFGLAVFAPILLILGIQISSYVKNEIVSGDRSWNEQLRNEKYMDLFESDLKFLNSSSDLKKLSLNRTNDGFKFIFIDHAFVLDKIQEKSSDITRLLDKSHLMTAAEFKNEFKKLDVDLDWLSEITNFDYIGDPVLIDSAPTKSRNSQYTQYFELQRPLNRASELVKAVRLYSVSLCLKKFCGRGHRIYHHTALLLNSVQDLFIKMTAYQHLFNEESFFKNLGYSVKGIDAKVLTAYRRVQWGWGAIVTESLLNHRLEQRWAPFARAELGFCTGVKEKTFGLKLVGRDYFRSPWFFEVDVQEDLVKEEITMRQFNSDCGFSALNRFIEKRDQSDHFFSMDFDYGSHWNLAAGNDGGGFYDYAADAYSRGELIQGSFLYLIRVPLKLLNHINLQEIPFIRTLAGARLIYLSLAGYWAIYRDIDKN